MRQRRRISITGPTVSVTARIMRLVLVLSGSSSLFFDTYESRDFATGLLASGCGVIDGSVDGAIDGSVEGTVDGAADGSLYGVVEGVVIGVVYDEIVVFGGCDGVDGDGLCYYDSVAFVLFPDVAEEFALSVGFGAGSTGVGAGAGLAQAIFINKGVRLLILWLFVVVSTDCVPWNPTNELVIVRFSILTLVCSFRKEASVYIPKAVEIREKVSN
jgi:hypothetical protein